MESGDLGFLFGGKYGPAGLLSGSSLSRLFPKIYTRP